MLGIILDAAVIMLIIYLLNQGQDLNLGPAIVSALIITLTSLACGVFLTPTIGVFALVPVLAVAILAIWIVSGMPLGKAAIGGVIFTVYKIGIALAFHAMAT